MCVKTTSMCRLEQDYAGRVGGVKSKRGIRVLSSGRGARDKTGRQAVAGNRGERRRKRE